MNPPAELVAALVAITVALIAGIVSFIVSVLSKDQKTSEFRQAWIDALRGDIADFVSKNLAFIEAVKIQGARPGADEELGGYLLSDRFQEMLDIEATRARILLRLNPKEHEAFIQLVNNVYGKSEFAKPDEHKGLPQRVEALIQESQTILKYEWGRVKTGEPIFRVTKWVSLIAAAAAFFIGAIYLWGHLHITYAPSNFTPQTTTSPPVPVKNAASTAAPG